MMRYAAILLTALAFLPQVTASPVETAEFRQLITDYYYAVGENQIEEAMNLYHEDSPQAEEARRELEQGQSAYLQRTNTLELGLVRRDGDHAVVWASHRHLRIVGVKFMEEFTEARYVLRRRGHTWKIWSSSGRAPRNVSPSVTRLGRE